MRQREAGRFWRKFAAGFAAYAIALQSLLFGLGPITAASSAEAAASICSGHAPAPAHGPSRPAGDPWLCPCAPGCLMTCSVLAASPALPAYILRAALQSDPIPHRRSAEIRGAPRGPQIPRAPPIA